MSDDKNEHGTRELIAEGEALRGGQQGAKKETYDTRELVSSAEELIGRKGQPGGDAAGAPTASGRKLLLATAVGLLLLLALAFVLFRAT